MTPAGPEGSDGSLVVDASIGVALVRRERLSIMARDELRARRGAGYLLLVPASFWIESINVLSRRYDYPAAAVLEAIYELEQLGLTTVTLDRPMILLTLDVVERHRLTAYDGLYLALAEASRAMLLTADIELARAAGDRAILLPERARGIAEHPAPYQGAPTWGRWPGSAAYLRDLRRRAESKSDGPLRGEQGGGLS